MGKFWSAGGKLFGRISLIDLAIFLVAAALIWRVVALYWPQPARYRKVEVTTGLIIRNVPPYIADSLEVGQDLFQDATAAYLGKVIAKTVAPAELILTEDGQLLLRRSPRNLDLRLKLQRVGRIRSGPAHAAVLLGKLTVRIGEPIRAHSLYTSLKGEVETLRCRNH